MTRTQTLPDRTLRSGSEFSICWQRPSEPIFSLAITFRWAAVFDASVVRVNIEGHDQAKLAALRMINRD